MTIKNTAQKYLHDVADLMRSHGCAVNYFAAQMTGERDSQQDRLKVVERVELPGNGYGDLLMVADGMGGHKGGELASELVVEVFEQTFRCPVASIEAGFNAALAQCERQMAEFIAANSHYEGMGTTVLAVLVVGRQIFWLSVGDSPLWLIREGVITRLNEDHSMLPVLNKMAQMGELSQQDVAQDPNRHVLRSVVNGKLVKLTDCQVEPVSLRPGDTLILASDGLQTLEESTISKIASSHLSALNCQPLVEGLLRHVEQCEVASQDNTSVIAATVYRPQSAYIILASLAAIVAGLLLTVGWALLGMGG